MWHRTVAYPTGITDTLPIFFNDLRRKHDGSVPYRRSHFNCTWLKSLAFSIYGCVGVTSGCYIPTKLPSCLFNRTDLRHAVTSPPDETRQCSLLQLSRSTLYYRPKGESAENLAFMEIIDKQFLETPWYGSRQMARHMERQGHKCGRHHAGSVPLARRVRRLMRLMRLVPIYQEPNTSKKHPAHKIYPYLLKGLAITRPNQVWCADITFVGKTALHAVFLSASLRMERGVLYLVAIMDWYSRKVIAWRLSNTLEADFCVSALKEALAKYGPPEIFNTDQGSQFTSSDWTCELKEAKVKISMDGKGRWIDNRMIERLWRSLKYECVYLRAFETGSQAREGIGRWLAYYNAERPHSTHGILTPDEVHASKIEPMRMAA